MLKYLEIESGDVRFAADSHFRGLSAPGEAQRRKLFFQFLETLRPGTALFLLGDIFDFFFEYRSVVSNKYVDLFRAFLDCRSRGVDVHFLGGNHDYWVGDFVEDVLGITTHADEIAISAQGRKIVCAHGDLIIPRDVGFKILKTVIRNRVVIALSKWIHPDLMDGIATMVSSGSRKFKKSSQEKRAQTLATLSGERLFKRGNDVFIMGHVHHPLHHTDGGREFAIVGDWVTNFTYGKLSEGRLTIEKFTAP